MNNQQSIAKMTDDRTEYMNKIPTDSGKLLYLDAETADVHFVIGSDDNSAKRIPAHKNLLAAASDVFKQMFYGPLKEKGDVRLDGINAFAFEEFLQFFYLENVKLTIDNVADVMDLGHKYNVLKCFEICVNFLKDILTDDTICIGLSLALLYDQNELKKFCEKRIIANTSTVLKSNSFLECDRQILKHILNINLYSCSEIDVFEACMSWIKVASKQQSPTKEMVQAHFGDLFYNIRFASMKMKDVANLTGPYGYLFSFDEYKEIVQMIELPVYQSKLFTAKPRELPWNKDAVVICDRTILTRPNTFSKSIKKIEATAFSTNEPILLGSLICTSLVDNRERKTQNSQSKQLVEVTIVEISGVDISESDQDNDDEILPEIRNNFRKATEFAPSLRNDQSVTSIVQNESQNGMPNVVVGENRARLVQEMYEDEDDSEDEEEEEPNDEHTEENDDDYDLIFEKTISNLKVYLRSKSRTKILLSKPVLIRPGFLYEIRIQQTPYKHIYNAQQLKTSVKLESGVTIRFHPDSLHNIKRYGLVTALEFNTI